jgi:hypothetical protein
VTKEWQSVLLAVAVTGLLFLLAALMPIPVKADQPLVPSTARFPGLGSERVEADDIVRPTIPCAVLAKYAGLGSKVPLTEGLGELYAASLRLHAVMAKSNKITKRMFLEATADVMACVDFSK